MGHPTGVGLGVARPTHPAPSRRRAAGPRLRRPDPAGTPPAATSTSTGIAWGGRTGVKPPFQPHCVPAPCNAPPPVEAAEDGGQTGYQVGHREPVGRILPDELQCPAPARAQEQLLRGLENTCKAPRPPVKRPNRLFANAGGSFKPPRGRGSALCSPLQRWEGAGGVVF